MEPDEKKSIRLAVRNPQRRQSSDNFIVKMMEILAIIMFISGTGRLLIDFQCGFLATENEKLEPVTNLSFPSNGSDAICNISHIGLHQDYRIALFYVPHRLVDMYISFGMVVKARRLMKNQYDRDASTVFATFAVLKAIIFPLEFAQLYDTQMENYRKLNDYTALTRCSVTDIQAFYSYLCNLRLCLFVLACVTTISLAPLGVTHKLSVTRHHAEQKKLIRSMNQLESGGDETSTESEGVYDSEEELFANKKGKMCKSPRTVIMTINEGPVMV